MKSLWLLLLLLITVFSSCKKENNAQNIVEFDIDGVHYSLTPSLANVTVDTWQGEIWKGVQINCNINSTSFFSISIGEYISDPAMDCLPTGIYFNDACWDSISYNCRTFNLVYRDINKVFGNAGYSDSSNILNLISCTGSPSKIDATFQGKLVGLSDSTSTRSITNGILRGVTYVRI